MSTRAGAADFSGLMTVTSLSFDNDPIAPAKDPTETLNIPLKKVGQGGVLSDLPCRSLLACLVDDLTAYAQTGRSFEVCVERAEREMHVVVLTRVEQDEAETASATSSSAEAGEEEDMSAFTSKVVQRVQKCYLMTLTHEKGTNSCIFETQDDLTAFEGALARGLDQKGFDLERKRPRQPKGRPEPEYLYLLNATKR